MYGLGPLFKIKNGRTNAFHTYLTSRRKSDFYHANLCSGCWTLAAIQRIAVFTGSSREAKAEKEPDPCILIGFALFVTLLQRKELNSILNSGEIMHLR